MTNKEWLFSLSDEDFTDWLYDFKWSSSFCDFIERGEYYHDHCWDYGACVNVCLKEWLYQERKES